MAAPDLANLSTPSKTTREKTDLGVQSVVYAYRRRTHFHISQYNMSASIRQQAIVSVLSKQVRAATANEPAPFPWEATWARYTFTDDDLKKRVPSSVFKSYKKATTTFQALEPAVADVVAAAMQSWAVERGCTHFCHWFQPIHIATAEKHECFIDLDHSTQRAILVRLASHFLSFFSLDAKGLTTNSGTPFCGPFAVSFVLESVFSFSDLLYR